MPALVKCTRAGILAVQASRSPNARSGILIQLYRSYLLTTIASRFADRAIFRVELLLLPQFLLTSSYLLPTYFLPTSFLHPFSHPLAMRYAESGLGNPISRFQFSPPSEHLRHTFAVSLTTESPRQPRGFTLISAYLFAADHLCQVPPRGAEGARQDAGLTGPAFSFPFGCVIQLSQPESILLV